MAIQVVSNSNIANARSMNSQTQNENNISSGSAVRIYDTEQNASNKVKAGVFLTTLLGVAGAMFATFRAKGMQTKSLKQFFQNLKNITYKEEDANGKKTFEMEKLIGRLAIGSVGGGLIGGAIFDKNENMNSKFRESIIQIVGNMTTPLACVSGGLALFEKFGGKDGKLKVLASAASLITGIFLGNKVGNTINKKAFNIDDERKIKITDMSPHIDDICLAISLAAAKGGNITDKKKIGKHIIKTEVKSGLADKVSKFIPAALMVAGVSTGIMQERPERVEAKKRKKLNKETNTKTEA